MRVLLFFGCVCVACSDAAPVSQPTPDSGANEAATVDAGDAAMMSDASATADASDSSDAAANACFVSTVGVFGECMTTAACTALGDRVSTPGYCPGPSSTECCTDAPDVSDNPPIPTGWKLMQQSQVTPAMTSWAVAILKAPTTYPMWSTTTQMFGAQNVMARVEWHPPDFQNNAIHRGVTLYVPG
jgi:hypothetical protein